MPKKSKMPLAMSNHKKLPDPAVIYQEAETVSEHEQDLKAAYDILSREVLKRRRELSTRRNPINQI